MARRFKLYLHLGNLEPEVFESAGAANDVHGLTDALAFFRVFLFL